MFMAQWERSIAGVERKITKVKHFPPQHHCLCLFAYYIFQHITNSRRDKHKEPGALAKVKPFTDAGAEGTRMRYSKPSNLDLQNGETELCGTQNLPIWTCKMVRLNSQPAGHEI